VRRWSVFCDDEVRVKCGSPCGPGSILPRLRPTVRRDRSSVDLSSPPLPCSQGVRSLSRARGPPPPTSAWPSAGPGARDRDSQRWQSRGDVAGSVGLVWVGVKGALRWGRTGRPSPCDALGPPCPLPRRGLLPALGAPFARGLGPQTGHGRRARRRGLGGSRAAGAGAADRKRWAANWRQGNRAAPGGWAAGARAARAAGRDVCGGRRGPPEGHPPCSSYSSNPAPLARGRTAPAAPRWPGRPLARSARWRSG
jgi:hypothetical protein